MTNETQQCVTDPRFELTLLIKEETEMEIFRRIS